MLVAERQVERRHDVIVQVGSDTARVIPIFPEAEEAIGVERACRGGAQPLLPVDEVVALAVRAGCRIDGPVPVAPGIVAAIGALGGHHLSQHAAADNVADLVPAGPGSALHAYLYDALQLPRAQVQLLGFFERVSHGLFDVHVFAGSHGGLRDRCVPMVGRGDENGVDVRALEQLPMMQVGFGADGFLRCPIEPLPVDIADRHDLYVAARFLPAHASVQVVGAARAYADLTHVDAVVSAENPGCRHGSAGHSKKTTPADLLHGLTRGSIVTGVPARWRPPEHVQSKACTDLVGWWPCRPS